MAAAVEMTVNEVLADLKANGSEPTRKTFLRHGAPDSVLGVKTEYLKSLKKKLKTNHALALKLYDTGVSDAMYLAALIADPQQFTKPILKKWVKAASWYMLSDYTVAWMAAESPHGIELAREWTKSKIELIASAGWCTWSGVVNLTPDAELPVDELKELIRAMPTELPRAANRVRYSMNSFLISVGASCTGLTAEAIKAAKAIGKVHVDMGDTSCKVPDVAEYIEKVKARGKLGVKRDTVVC